ncbi:hypothetical protein OQ496_02265 [Acetobacter suratthaniensis]|uniref:ABC transporter substrate-binding protein n=1 Tax=Acetobacter suratthaniensis TaxID=1502841 RepID=A0ABS3LHQ9_9PROT|nr:hypothetical protein [Acetobacter suratthaniensis]MBO1327111.1 hypothetical protein [Acetobacter suratthaniensis]MCX2565278.1 hypothetical protein [Acetobacter suratthaniensis]
MSRRLFLGGLAGGAGVSLLAPSLSGNVARAENSLNDSLPPQTRSLTQLIVAGTPETPSGRWASLLTPLLEENLQRPSPFTLSHALGWDGVTGANLFDAQQQAPDAPSALMAPGTVMLAAMLGDARVHYDYERWLPVFMACQPTVTIGHVSLHLSLGALLGNRKARVAVSRPTGPELPTLLALDLLGLRPLPVSGYATPESAMDALYAGTVDVIQIPLDREYEARIATLGKQGFVPLFINTPNALPVSEPALPPGFMTVLQHERRKIAQTPLASAWQALATAASIKTALLLPLLTPPAAVARWRHAAEISATRPTISNAAAENRESIKTGPTCMALYNDTMPDVSLIMTIRRWLALNLPRWRDPTHPG